MAISLGILTQHFQTNPHGHVCHKLSHQIYKGGAPVMRAFIDNLPLIQWEIQDPKMEVR